MNQNEPPPIPPALNQIAPNRGMSRKWKIVLAGAVGVALISLACFLAWAGAALVGGEIGDAAKCFCVSFIGMGVCFLITQYFLSRGNRQAVCKDWPLILAMNFAPFCSVMVALTALTKWAALVMLAVTLITLACSYAGAGLAALTACRRSS